ncbi:hypothetical protein E2320_002132 [Naja naja]|nr:hypothetical protein E2320_002132 [Naja naja]
MVWKHKYPTDGKDLHGQATLPYPLIDRPLMAEREYRATILEWRAATGPIGPTGDHNELAEWQYQMALTKSLQDSSREWVREQAQMRPAQAAAPPPQHNQLMANAPTPFKTMFDGTSIFPE